MTTMRLVVMVAMATLLVVVANEHTAAGLPDLSACSETITKLTAPVADPCTMAAYTALTTCADYMQGSVAAPSANCCSSSQTVWSDSPECFCKVTFFSKYSQSPGPARALARPALCNVTADLCNICLAYVSKHQSENSGEHRHSGISTAAVVTISVIVTLALVGCGFLVYYIRKKFFLKQDQSKSYVQQFNSMLSHFLLLLDMVAVGLHIGEKQLACMLRLAILTRYARHTFSTW